ncbi:MAG: CRISPR-associated helicase Cas3' [Zestosphaera tikiterensis]|uniref:CRISPR-associated helicase Cas3 n=1 Tax=Zestosphaera tikiterensis TaxID=1973259 RepID=A0A2R7Y153_9CREN|nr:MAG: CRISPR-associated helicase Cas3' [Zestosphaera tikiterensis]
MVFKHSFKVLYETIDKYFKEKHPSKYRSRPFLRYAIDELERLEPDERVFITAPTGYGKTALSMIVSLDSLINGYKSIVSYPLKALVEDQAIKFKEFYKSLMPNLEEVVGIRMMGVRESPYLIHPVTLSTIDTLSLTAIGISPEDISKVFESIHDSIHKSLGHYLFSWASVWLSTIVLDEVHLLYDTSKSLSFLAAMLWISSQVGNQLIFMSATMPNNFIQSIKDVVEGFTPPIKVRELSMKKDDDPVFYEERLNKRYKINLKPLKSETKFEEVKSFLTSSSFRKALVIFNTVEDAVKFYQLLPSTEKIIIHSRLTEEDKRKRVAEVRSDESPYKVIITTQVVEAGLDISTDLIITEVAPPNSLVQRFGRFLRREGEKCSDYERCAYIWYEENELDGKERYKVYDAGLVRETVNYLSENQDLNLHIDYEDFLNSIYTEVPQFNRALLSKIMKIWFNPSRASESAIKLLLDMEGSLVREGALFTVVTEDGVELVVDYNFLSRRCVNKEPVECPKNVRDALIKSLKGVKFTVRGTYDKEVGLL